MTLYVIMKLFIKHFLILSIFSLTLNSCKRAEKPIVKNLKTITGILPILVPNQDKFDELKPSFIKNKNTQINHFYQLNWPNNSLNGSFLVAQNGQIIYEKYNGFANFNQKSKIDANTPIHIASVSKVLTATAILMLVADKKIKLNQKINTIFPLFPYENITVQNLLNHRSGLKNYAYFTNKKEIWNSDVNLTNDDLLDILINKNIPLEFPSDKGFSYSNTNYALLALVIEKITGLKYPKAIKKMIFEPLSMTNSYVYELDEHYQTATPSYKWNNQQYANDFLDAIYGDKNIYSTPRDLLKFDLARQSKYFLNLDLIQKIYSGYSYEHRGTKNYGLGIRMIEWENGQKFYFHNGWWHGNTSSFISLNKEKLTIIALSNKFNRATYKVKRVASLFGDYPFKVSDTI